MVSKDQVAERTAAVLGAVLSRFPDKDKPLDPTLFGADVSKNGRGTVDVLVDSGERVPLIVQILETGGFRSRDRRIVLEFFSN